MLKGLPQSQFIRPKNIGNIAERLAEYTWYVAAVSEP